MLAKDLAAKPCLRIVEERTRGHELRWFEGIRQASLAMFELAIPIHVEAVSKALMLEARAEILPKGLGDQERCGQGYQEGSEPEEKDETGGAQTLGQAPEDGAEATHNGSLLSLR